jgi:hypothetical protein
MPRIVSLLFVLATSSASFAQTHPASWENLSSLHPGQQIQVVEIDAKKHAGSFVSVSGTSIVFTETTGDRTVQKQDVRIVKLMRSGHHLRNVLIGAGVGAGAGAGIAAGAWESGGFLGGRGTGAAVGAVIGGLGGAVVGALVHSHDTIYNINSRQPPGP